MNRRFDKAKTLGPTKLWCNETLKIWRSIDQCRSVHVWLSITSGDHHHHQQQ